MMGDKNHAKPITKKEKFLKSQSIEKSMLSAYLPSPLSSLTDIA
jgi:hypothetical protein